jgi:Flp pilus assembly pilin Flp
MLTDIKRYATTLRGRGVRGQTMTEYALILAAVAIVAIVGYLALGTAVAALITKVVADL